jgi:hypothetical protein
VAAASGANAGSWETALIIVGKALGEMRGIVSRIFPDKADAKAEATRLAAQEAKKT